VKVATLGVYAAVALAAMLAVALIMNQGGGDGREKLLPPDGVQSQDGPEEVGGRAPSLPVENLPPGRGPGTEIRNVIAAPEVEPAPPVKASRGREPAPPAESPPAVAAAPEARVFTGDEAPKGFYIQIQSMVSPEHFELMVEHVRSLGFNSFWKRPMLESQAKQKSKVPQWYILRLGPYPARQTAVEEMARFLKAIGEKPLKKPKGIKWAPFVPQAPYVPQGENP
jgi:cell division septation protein DedD